MANIRTANLALFKSVRVQNPVQVLKKLNEIKQKTDLKK